MRRGSAECGVRGWFGFEPGTWYNQVIEMAKKLSESTHIKKGKAREEQIAKTVVSSSACEGIKVKEADLKSSKRA